MRKTILGLLIFATVVACNKKDDDDLPETTGVLQLLDGCSSVIALEDGTRLEVVSNISGMDLQLNRPFAFRYRIKSIPGGISICMVGKGVEIVSLRYL